MAFESDFYSMFAHTVRIAPYVGMDKYRKPAHGAYATFPCRITGRLLSLRRAESELQTQIFDIYLHAPGTRISVRDKVELPDVLQFGDDREPVIYAVVVNTDDQGYHHHKVQLGWMYHRQTA